MPVRNERKFKFWFNELQELAGNTGAWDPDDVLYTKGCVDKFNQLVCDLETACTQMLAEIERVSPPPSGPESD